MKMEKINKVLSQVVTFFSLLRKLRVIVLELCEEIVDLF